MASTDLICSACGAMGKTKTITRGSLLIEIILWLCFLVPGLIYSIWRHTTRHDGCAVCGAEQLIPVSSPRGGQIAREFHGEPATAEPVDTYKGNATRGTIYLIVIAIAVIALIVRACM